MKLFIIIIIISTVLLHSTFAARILVVLPHVYFSHFKATSKLVTELNLQGHEVTMVSPYPNVINGYYNITEIDISNIRDPLEDKESLNRSNLTDSTAESGGTYYTPTGGTCGTGGTHPPCWTCSICLIKQMGCFSFLQDHRAYISQNCTWIMNSGSSLSFWSHLQYTRQIGYQYSKQIFENDNFKNLVYSNSTFDLVIMEDIGADALAILAHIFKCPLIALLSEPVSQFYDIYMSDNIIWKQFDVFQNSHVSLMKQLYREWNIISSQNKLIQKLIPDAPDVRNILYTTSLVLVPSYMTIGNLISKYLNVKQVGGFHIDEISTFLQENVESLDQYDKGVIVISSNLPNFAKETLKKVFQGNAKMSEDIIFTSDVAGVVAHPNVKLLITDGDVYDISRAIFHHVPIVSISLNIWEKRFLVDILAEMGFVPIVPIDELESPVFSTTVNELLLLSNNIRLRQHLELASKILDTHSTSPRDEAIFWIEHVLEFHGASHLTPYYLRWSNKNNLILLAVVLTLIDIVLFIIFYWIIKHFFKILFSVAMVFYRVAQKIKNKKEKASISYIKL